MTDRPGAPSEGKAAWQAMATRSGVAVESLTAHTDDGLPVGPIYPAGDEPPLAARFPGAPWAVYQRIDTGDPDAVKAEARAALSGGATGIALVFADCTAAHGTGLTTTEVDWAGVILAVLTAGADLRIEAGPTTARLIEQWLPTAVAANTGRLSLAYDPVATLTANGYAVTPPKVDLDGLVALGTAMDAAGLAGETMIVDGRPWHDAGASEAQELAAVVSSVLAYLRHSDSRGIDLARAADRLGIMLTADCDQFLTIAKFRAARLLFGRLMELIQLDSRAFRVGAQTSWRMMCRRDPYLNLLRTTTATLAAATGGADSITVLPFDLGTDSFADRMARNVQTVSRDEAALGRVADPGAGSGAIESLTNDLAAVAWAEFQSLEAEGGLLASVRAGAIQDRIAAIAAKRRDKIARREIEIVGVNANVDRGQALPPSRPEVDPTATPDGAVITVTPLHPRRLAESYEALCDRASALSAEGTPPTVFMAKVGQPGPAAQAVSAAIEALATSGMTTTEAVDLGDATHAHGPVKGVEGAAVCLAAPPDVPPETLAAAAAHLRAAGAAFVILAKDNGCDAPPPEIDNVLWAGANLPVVLSRLLDAIAIIAKNRQNQTMQQ